jgi:site-specific recombinase
LQEAEARDLPQEEIDSWLTRVKSWSQVKARLLSKETLSDIARWLEVTEPEAKRIKLESLIRLLGRIRAKLTENETQAKLAELQRKADEAQGNADGSKKTAQYIDVLESLAELFSLQMERIKKGREIENKVNYLLTKLTQDIGEAREILKFIFEVQQELGLAKRRPMEFTGKMAVLSFEQRQVVSKALDVFRQKVLAKQLESKVVQEVAEEVVLDMSKNVSEQGAVEQISIGNGKVIDIEPTDVRTARNTGQVIPIADKFVDPEAVGKPDVPWEE